MFMLLERKKYIVERKIHDAIFLINTKQNYLNDKCNLYEINEMGSFIWNMLDGSNSTDKVVEEIIRLVNEDIEPTEVFRDVNEYVNILLQEEFLEVK